jgi:hypothetical protein
MKGQSETSFDVHAQQKNELASGLQSFKVINMLT